MLSVCRAEEPDIRIAKVDMRELEPLLLEVAFARPANHEVRDRYAASQERERAFLASKFDPAEAARGFSMDKFELAPTIKALARGELILLIEAVFGDRYQVVVDDGFGDGVLYTDVVIPDITPNIRQELLKRRTAGQGEAEAVGQ
jgi:hypothetical protein